MRRYITTPRQITPASPRIASGSPLRPADKPPQRSAPDTVAIRQLPSARDFDAKSSIALELIIKTVVAQRIESKMAAPHVTRVRPVHDLVSLWKDAQLPKLERADHHRLLIAKRWLYWASRYAAPMSDEQYEKEEAELEKYEQRSGNLGSYRPSFDWDDFDRLYQIASNAFWSLPGAGGNWHTVPLNT